MEDRCHMISALDRYRIKAASYDLTDVKKYLKDHFKDDAKIKTTAACVDSERYVYHCCLRSNRVTDEITMVWTSGEVGGKKK